MEERLEEVKVGDRVFRCYKIDYARLERRQAYKASAFPMVENNGAEIEAAAACSVPRAPTEYTHFVSIPLYIYKDVKGNYAELKKAILSDKEDPVDPALFIPEGHIHLTLTMLRLEDKAEIEAAGKALVQAWNKAEKELKLMPIRLRLKGLGCFGKRADRTNLVYGKLVEDEGWEKLLKLGDLVVKHMVAAKVCAKDELQHITYYPDQDVYRIDQLHMTLMNTKFKAKAAGGKEKQYLFDANPILKYYGDYELGKVTVERIELSRIREDDPATGYYACEQAAPDKQVYQCGENSPMRAFYQVLLKAENS